MERPSREERMIGWAAWATIAALVIFMLAGCSTRYLTAEQDAELREACEATGCKVVPSPIWRQIEEILRMIVQPETRRG